MSEGQESLTQKSPHPTDTDPDSEAPETEEDQLFNDYIRKRLGPLVHFDEKTYKLKFLVKEKFKDNDQRKMTAEEREGMLDQMRRSAHDYKEQQTAIITKDRKRDAESDQKGKGTGEVFKGVTRDAYGMGGGGGTLGENLERGKYFVDQKVLRDDANTFS